MLFQKTGSHTKKDEAAIETVSKPPTKTKTAIATDKNLKPQVSYCLSVARLVKLASMPPLAHSVIFQKTGSHTKKDEAAIETVSKPPTKTKTAIATDKNLKPQVSYCLSVARLMVKLASACLPSLTA